MNKSSAKSVLSDFELMQAACEFRTDPTFLLWDRTGSIWTDMAALLPDLAVVKADPAEQVFKVPGKYELKSSLKSHTLIAFKPPKSLKEFGKLQADFTKIIENRLQIEHYKRVGIRLIYSKEFKTRTDVFGYLVEKTLYKPLANNYFGVDGSSSELKFLLKVESEKNGWMLHLTIDERTYSIDVPLDWDLPRPEPIAKIRLLIDIDRYEHGLLPSNQLNIEDWIRTNSAAINRDADKVISEAFSR